MSKAVEVRPTNYCRLCGKWDIYRLHCSETYSGAHQPTETKWAIHIEGFGYVRTSLGEVKLYSTASNARRAYRNF